MLFHRPSAASVARPCRVSRAGQAGFEPRAQMMARARRQRAEPHSTTKAKPNKALVEDCDTIALNLMSAMVVNRESRERSRLAAWAQGALDEQRCCQAIRKAVTRTDGAGTLLR